MRPEYADAVLGAGGIPVAMPPIVERSKIEEWLDRVGGDALLLTGGCDPDSQIYKEIPRRELGRVSLRRDVYELELLDAAMRRGMPVLGICRGLQIINIGLGGSLYQDMRSQMGEEFATHQQAEDSEEPVHRVAFTADSWAAELFGTQFVDTNSHHHQCVRTVAEHLEVTGTTVDGVVESLEWRERGLLAVQFHPERMVENDPSMKQFFDNWTEYVVDFSQRFLKKGQNESDLMHTLE